MEGGKRGGDSINHLSLYSFSTYVAFLQSSFQWDFMLEISVREKLHNINSWRLGIHMQTRLLLVAGGRVRWNPGIVLCVKIILLKTNLNFLAVLARSPKQLPKITISVWLKSHLVKTQQLRVWMRICRTHCCRQYLSITCLQGDTALQGEQNKEARILSYVQSALQVTFREEPEGFFHFGTEVDYCMFQGFLNCSSFAGIFCSQ